MILFVGVDSSSVACLVASMCHLVCQSVKNGDTQVLEDARRIVDDRWVGDVLFVSPNHCNHASTIIHVFTSE